VADDDRILRERRADALVRIALHGELVGRHADGVAHDAGKNFVVLQAWQLEFLESQIVHAIYSDRFGFHSKPPI